MNSIAVDVLEDTLKGHHPDHHHSPSSSPRGKRSSARGINSDDFETAMGALCAVLSSREIQSIFDLIGKEASGGEDGDEDDTGRLSVRTIVKFIEETASRRRNARQGQEGGGGDFCLLSDLLLTDVQQSAAAFMDNSRTGLSKVIAGFGAPIEDTSSNKRSSAGASSLTAGLSRSAFNKALEHIGCQLEEKDLHVLFEALDVGGHGVVLSDDLAAFCFTLAQGDDGSGEAGKVLHQVCTKRRVGVSDFAAAFLPHDRRKKHLIEAKQFEKSVEKLAGSRPGITSSQMSDLFLFFDPKQQGVVDYGIVCALVDCSVNTSRVHSKLAHVLKVMRIRGIEYHQLADEYEKKVSPDDMVAMFSRMQIPLTECELYTIAAKYQSRQKINVAAMLEKLEADEDKAGLSRYSRLFGSKGKDKHTVQNYDFGKVMFKKICKLRANSSKAGDCRAALMGHDPDLDGKFPQRDLERSLNKYADFSEAELNLLAENLGFVDGSHRSEIDYPLLLLLMHEPLDHAGRVVAVGQGMMEKMLPATDSVSLRRLKALLFRNFAASDSTASGTIPYSAAELVLKDECPGVDRKRLGKLLGAFQDRSSDDVLYPELLSFLCCCSLWNVMFNLHLLDKIRRKQGYNFTSHLLKNSSREKLDRDKVAEIFLGIGILLSEVAMESIFSKYATSDDIHLNVTEFVKGLQAMDSTDGAAPHKRNRKELVTYAPTGDGDVCDVSEKILSEYDAKMLKAIALAFDMFDQNAADVIAALDIERVLSALGQQASPDEIQELLQQIDPKETNEVEYNVFMDAVVPFIRSKYPLTFALSEERLRKYFRTLDMKQDGTVSHNEFRYILGRVAEGIEPEEQEAMIEFLDTDENGSIDWDEFRALHVTTTDSAAMRRLPEPVRHGLRKVRHPCSLTHSLFYYLLFTSPSVQQTNEMCQPLTQLNFSSPTFSKTNNAT
jgi:Ca2+-binding EF-hand superfamily protein